LVVYGTWPYPSYRPVCYPPPPAYYPGAALATGIAFAAGVAVVGSLWGWSDANWGYGGCCSGGGSINVNRERYNNITVNNPTRGNFNGSNWQASSRSAAGRPACPPGGPVKAPARVQGLPANAVGRPSVSVPGNAVSRPNIGAGGLNDGARAGQFQQRGSRSRALQSAGGGRRR